MELILATRKSALAQTQTQRVMKLLKEKSGVDSKKFLVVTEGDKRLDVSLNKIGGKGLFTKEIEIALLENKAHAAIHSMKDVPYEMGKHFELIAMPEREDVRDVLVCRNGLRLEELKKGAIIGTSSIRRAAQIKNIRNDLNIVPIRGNIDTRIRKIEDENLDGIVLAAAGLNRAGLNHHISYHLPVDIMIPAPAQGALALEIREDDSNMEEIISHIKDEMTEIQVAAERGFLRGVNGSCHIPMGAYCEIKDNKLNLSGLYGDEEGNKLVIKSITGAIEEAEKIGFELAKNILKEYNSL